LQTGRLTKSFEGLDSYLAQFTGEVVELQNATKLMLNAWFQSMTCSYTAPKIFKKLVVSFVHLKQVWICTF